MSHTPKITFLHTSPAHIATFDTLLTAASQPLTIRHLVREEWLAEARANGLHPSLEREVIDLLTAETATADVIICTCSTLGPCAEAADVHTARPILRVDRPLAEKAVALGSRILVAATLASTFDSTKSLLLNTAQRAQQRVELIEVDCTAAWPHFEAGNLDGYAQSIAGTLQTVWTEGDVIVLAQASMAPAAALCPAVEIPILSSPQLAIDAALKLIA